MLGTTRSLLLRVGGAYFLRVREVLVALTAIGYLLSPIDFIPEAVFGLFGLLDDLLVLVCLVIFVAVVVRNVIRFRI